MKPAVQPAASGSFWSYPVLRLLAGLALSTIGSSAMYVVSVVLPYLQDDFCISRSDAALPYSFIMIGFGLGGILMGWLADRFGTIVPISIGTLGLATGYWLAAQSQSLAAFSLIHGVLLGLLGASATFSPLLADISIWFTRRRGIAVAIIASGNFLAGTIWPPIVQAWIDQAGWRSAYETLAWIVLSVSFPLAAMLFRRAPESGVVAPGTAETDASGRERPLGLSPPVLQTLLCVAGLGCCVAMAMPQVHIVAYCADLGYGAARGAQMLSLMLGFGIVSRLVSGVVCDRIGGLATLMIGSALQCTALVLFLFFDSLVSLYVISAVFGLFQGGLVPTYAIVVREYFSPRQAGVRVGIVLTATMAGMALGGWMSGWVFDLTGSYDAAFLNGIGWNAMNFIIIVWLFLRARRLRPVGPPAVASPA